MTILARPLLCSFSSFCFVLFPLSCGVDVDPCSTAVLFISRQYLLFDIIVHVVHHRQSGHPLFLRPCTFISIAPFLHRPSAHSLLITCPCHFYLLSWTSFAISPTFVGHHILSFLILSSFVTLNIHRSILISATNTFFHVPSSMFLPRTPVPVLPLS